MEARDVTALGGGGAAMGGMTRVSSGTTLVEVVGAGDAAAAVDHLVARGRTIDLFDLAQVRAEIGRVDGLASRGSSLSAFIAYAVPDGEIIFNADVDGRLGGRYLGTSWSCGIPIALIHSRLCAPGFLPFSPTPFVMHDEYAHYRDRPATCIVVVKSSETFVHSLGIMQREPGT